MHKKIVILMGPPGCGKGTQAASVREYMNLPHISTGALLKTNIANGSELGIKIKEIMDQGLFVPDECIIDMLLKRVSEEDCKRGFILDGFPRTIAQAEALQKALSSSDHHLYVLYFNVDDQEVIKRITGRMICEECSMPFHKDFSPPKMEGVCDHCGGRLIQRADDTQEVVTRRLGVYHDQTKPLIEFYTNEGLLEELKASKRPEEVFADIQKILENTPQKKGSPA